IAVAVHPLVVSSAVQPNVDYGVMVFFLVTLAALVEGRTRAAAAAGILLVFAKETGIIGYRAMIALYGVLVLARPRDDLRTAWRRIRPHAALAAPVVLALGYVVVRRMSPRNQAGMWIGSGTNLDLAASFLSFRPLDPIFHNYLAAI